MRMRRIQKAAYFWPGLPQLWIGGSWAGLLVAVGFTALANVLLLATLVFDAWLPSRMLLAGYSVLAVVWLAVRWQSRAERQALCLDVTEDEAMDDEATDQSPAERDLLFREAQGHYLSNDWVATEQVLLKLLKQDARDVESRLMLATLWRHQGRGAEALRQLDRLERLEAAETWQHEIAAERSAIDEMNDEVNDEVNDEANDEINNDEADEVSDVSLKLIEPPEASNEDTNRREAA